MQYHGRYEVEIPENTTKEISFICSLEDDIENKDIKEIINKEIKRINELIRKTEILDDSKEQEGNREIIKNFIMAIDNFIVYKQDCKNHTIIAGYPWFLDWGRDALISFEGLLLCTKNYEIAKEILITMTNDINSGLVPNGYSEYDNKPLYNSVDTSLLLFEQVKKYLKYTSDYKFIEDNIYNKLVSIIENYQKGIDLDDNNIFLDKDFLISSGTEYTQNTWMDAKYANHSFTPRNGKAVEINSLWYNALKIMEELSIKFGKEKEAKEYSKLAEKCKKSFNEQFYNPKKKCLYDVIGDSKVRPNQLFALSLNYQVIDANSEIAKNILDTVTKKLLNKYGLKTLAKDEKNYIDVYEGDGFKRDSSYHQGITWVWLLGLYYDALKNMMKAEKNKEKKKELEEELKNLKEKTEKTFSKELFARGAVGQISEIYDSKTPNLPKGCFAQCWSVAEIFRIINDK